jgi:hypothetical protein
MALFITLSDFNYVRKKERVPNLFSDGNGEFQWHECTKETMGFSRTWEREHSLRDPN